MVFIIEILKLVPRGTQLTDHILIGTPGKLLDWATKFRCFDLSKVKVFVLDEADEMLGRGFVDEIREIFENLPADIQVCLFSATMPP